MLYSKTKQRGLSKGFPNGKVWSSDLNWVYTSISMFTHFLLPQWISYSLLWKIYGSTIDIKIQEKSTMILKFLRSDKIIGWLVGWLILWHCNKKASQQRGWKLPKSKWNHRGIEDLCTSAAIQFVVKFNSFFLWKNDFWQAVLKGVQRMYLLNSFMAGLRMKNPSLKTWLKRGKKTGKIDPWHPCNVEMI